MFWRFGSEDQGQGSSSRCLLVPYLNDVDFFSAIVPNLKLLAVPPDALCDPDRTHLEQTNQTGIISALPASDLSGGNV